MSIDQLTQLAAAAQLAAANAQKWAMVANHAAEMLAAESIVRAEYNEMIQRAHTRTGQQEEPAMIPYSEAREILLAARSEEPEPTPGEMPAQQEPASVETSTREKFIAECNRATAAAIEEATKNNEAWFHNWQARVRAQDTTPGESPAQQEAPPQPAESSETVLTLPDKQYIYIGNMAVQHAAAELTIRTPRPPEPTYEQDTRIHRGAGEYSPLMDEEPQQEPTPEQVTTVATPEPQPQQDRPAAPQHIPASVYVLADRLLQKLRIAPDLRHIAISATNGLIYIESIDKGQHEESAFDAKVEQDLPRTVIEGKTLKAVLDNLDDNQLGRIEITTRIDEHKRYALALKLNEVKHQLTRDNARIEARKAERARHEEARDNAAPNTREYLIAEQDIKWDTQAIDSDTKLTAETQTRISELAAALESFAEVRLVIKAARNTTTLVTFNDELARFDAAKAINEKTISVDSKSLALLEKFTAKPCYNKNGELLYANHAAAGLATAPNGNRYYVSTNGYALAMIPTESTAKDGMLICTKNSMILDEDERAAAAAWIAKRAPDIIRSVDMPAIARAILPAIELQKAIKSIDKKANAVKFTIGTGLSIEAKRITIATETAFIDADYSATLAAETTGTASISLSREYVLGALTKTAKKDNATLEIYKDKAVITTPIGSVIIMPMAMNRPTPPPTTPNPSAPQQDTTPTPTAFKRPASVESEQVTTVTESPATDEQPPAYDPALDMPRRIMARLESIENDPAAYIIVRNVTVPERLRTKDPYHDCGFLKISFTNSHSIGIVHLQSQSTRYFQDPAQAEIYLREYSYDPYNPPEIKNHVEHDAPSQSTPTPTPTSVESAPPPALYVNECAHEFMRLLHESSPDNVVTMRLQRKQNVPVEYIAYYTTNHMRIIVTSNGKTTATHNHILRGELLRYDRVITAPAIGAPPPVSVPGAGKGETYNPRKRRQQDRPHEPLGANLDRDLGY